MRHPLTILMVTNNYTPYAGGVVSSLRVTRDALQKLGHRVIIVTLDFQNERKLNSMQVQSDEAVEAENVVRLSCPIQFLYRGNPMAIPLFPTHQIRRIIDQHQPDIVHVHHPWLLGSCAQKVAQRRKIPVVFTYHTLYDQYVHYIPLFRHLGRLIVTHSVKKFCHKVDAVIVPSKSIQEYILRQGIETAVVPSGILPGFIVPEKKNKRIPTAHPELSRRMHQALHVSTDAQHERVKSEGDLIELLTVSRFTKEKNISFLFDMFKKLGPGYRLTLIGFGSEQRALESYAYETSQLSREQVRFIVQPTKEIILAWYQKAHLFVFASVSETQGLVLAEAMASGTPVIALRGPGVVDIVESGLNGYMVDSTQEMASQIKNTMHDPERYALLQEGAHETAKRYYPDKAIQALLDVYEKLLSRGNG